VEKSSYVINEYIGAIAKENEESNSTLLLSRLVKIKPSFFLKKKQKSF